MQRNSRFACGIGHAPTWPAWQIDRHLPAIVQPECVQRRSFPVVADAGDNPERKALDDGRAVRPCAGLEHGLGFERRSIQPGEACRAAIGDENFTVVGDGAGDTRKSRQRRDVFARIVIDHLDACCARYGR